MGTARLVGAAGALALASWLALATHGGVRSPVIEGLALLGPIGMLFAARGRVRLPPLAWPPLAMAALALLALLPLPLALRRALAPTPTAFYALITPPAAWAPISVEPEATASGALRLAAVAALACVAAQLARDERGRRWLRALALVGVGWMALAALAAAGGVALPGLAPRGRALWPSPFFNPNHAGAFWVLSLPVLVALLRRLDGWPARVGVALVIAAGNLALLATLSRAAVTIGVAAQLVAVLVVVGGGRRGRRALLAVAGVGVLAFLLMWRLRAGAALVASLRWPLWRGVWPLMRDHVWLGVGRGAFPTVLTRYTPLAASNQFDFVENEALQPFIDSGLVGGLLVLALALLAARALWRRRVAGSEMARAALVGLAGLAVCNLGDFSWEMPAIAIAAAAWAGLAAPEAGPRLSAWWLRAGAGALALAALWRLGSPPLRAPRPPSNDAEVEGFAAAAEGWLRRHPGDGQLALDTAGALEDSGRDASAWLERALLLLPFDARPALTAARLFASHGAREPARAQLRRAVQGGINHPAVVRTTLALFGDEPATVLELLGDKPALTELAFYALNAEPSRWPEAGMALGERRLQLAPDDVLAARIVTISALAAHDEARVLPAARRWLALAPAQAETLTRALVSNGAAAQAAALLRDSDAARSAPMACAQAATLLVDAGALPAAEAIPRVEAALARAVDRADKRALYLMLSRLADRAGDPARAAAERGRARD